MALGLTLSGGPGRAESLCCGWRGGFQHWLSCCRTNCGNLDTGVPNRVHQSFTAREYINYKQTRPLVLVEQHGDQRDTMETHLLLQPSSPSSGRAARGAAGLAPSVTRHPPPVVLRNQYRVEITYCYLDHLLFCPLMNYGSPHNIKSTISIAFANH